MQKYKRVFSFVIVLLLLVGLWVIIAFVNIYSTKDIHSNKSLLPDDIDVVMTLNTQDLIKTFLFDLLFKADIDENTASLFTPKERDELNKLGADLTSEVIIFYEKWKESSAQGFLFNIANEGDFQRYQTEYISTIKVSNSKYGVLINLDEKASQETLNHFTILAEKIINSEKKGIEKDLTKAMVNLEYKGKDGDYLEELNLDLNMKNQSIFINGKGKLIEQVIAQSSKRNILNLPASKKYFQIQTSDVPEDAMNHLSTSFDKLGIKIPSVSSMQLLVYGVTIDNIDGSMAVLPNLDWILRFDEALQVDSMLKNLNPNYKSLVDFNNKKITIGNVAYNYKQISQNEIYLGVTENPVYAATELKPYYAIGGYPSAVLEIDGQGFVASFIQMMPPVKLSKQFLEDVTHFDIRSEQVGDSLEIKGEISIKDGKLISVELVKYVMLFIR